MHNDVRRCFKCRLHERRSLEWETGDNTYLDDVFGICGAHDMRICLCGGLHAHESLASDWKNSSFCITQFILSENVLTLVIS